MAEPETRSNEEACVGCPYPRDCYFESSLPEDEIQDDVQRMKIEAEISELKVRERHIREMRQLRECMVRNYLARKSVSSSNRCILPYQ